jgi:hypothetical protein
VWSRYLVAITRPRIVHQHIQSAKLLKSEIDHGLPVVETGDVLFLKEQVGRVRRGDFLATVGVDVGQDDLGALLAETGGDGGAEARSSSFFMRWTMSAMQLIKYLLYLSSLPLGWQVQKGMELKSQ